jgi:cellulose synthase/poly-beta-1,6-N-acetylglucosamine synthase-like glycosyltransferase
MAIQSVIYQTKLPDKLVIFDDNDEPEDVRNNNIYQHLFSIMNYKGIKWEWVYAAKKGQHHIHQSANRMGYDWVWRVDDDAIPEPNVLAELYSWIDKDVGAIGGAILTLPINPDTSKYECFFHYTDEMIFKAGFEQGYNYAKNQFNK